MNKSITDLWDDSAGSGSFMYFSQSERATAGGRPTISASDLMGRRDRLVWFLSYAWADIGWQLPKARSSNQLREALAPLRRHSSEYLVSWFLHQTPIRSTAKEIRKLRRELGEAVDRMITADQTQRSCAASFAEAQNAVGVARENPQGTDNGATRLNEKTLSGLREELTKRQAKSEFADNALAEARKNERELREQLQRKEAGFAQAELLKFIGGKRYARNPLGFANVMAGLPDMGWRQSYSRCSKIPCTGWPQLPFTLFLTIKRIWNRRHSSPKIPIVQLFQKEVAKLQRTVIVTIPGWPDTTEKKNRIENPLRSRLAENFRYLRLAIEEAVTGKHHPGQVPFLITAQFWKGLEKGRDAVESVLAAQEQIK